MNNLRREQLRAFIESKQVVTLEQLFQLVPDVSLMTIHRDLNYLRDKGFIAKVRGGARYLVNNTNEPAFATREILNQDAKEAISEKAVRLLTGSNSIFMDAGTTMMTFTRRIPDSPISILTTGPNIALALAQKSNLRISLCGGVLNKSNLTLSGSAALETVSKINIDTAFLAASGYSASGGFTCGKEGEARIKELVIQKARTAVLLMDSSKIEKMHAYTFAQIKNFHYIITEKKPDDLPGPFREAAQASGVHII